MTAGQAARLRAHLEAGRQFYNAVLSQGQMRADPAWQAARRIPCSRKQERQAAFSALREQYGFTEYALHAAAKGLRTSWLAEHLDAVLAQTVATRAYRALNRVCLGKARRVRFKSKARGLSSIENKRNDTGLRFVLQTPQAGHHGYLLWQEDQLEAIIDWNDPVVKHGLDHTIKYARLIRRRAKSSRAQGADGAGYRYFVQWEGAETRLRAAQERLLQRANEGQVLPRSMGMPRARARRPQSLSQPTQEPLLLLSRGRVEAWNQRSEPPVL